MRKAIFLLIAICVGGCVTSQVVQKPDGTAYHVYSGLAISVGVGAGIYKVTHKTGLALVSGFLASACAGIVKEAVWDGAMHRGVVSNSDAVATIWGGACGSICLAIGINVHRVNQLEKEYYQNLNPNPFGR